MPKRKGTKAKSGDMKTSGDVLAEIKKKIKLEKEALLKIIQNLQDEK